MESDKKIKNDRYIKQSVYRHCIFCKNWKILIGNDGLCGKYNIKTKKYNFCDNIDQIEKKDFIKSSKEDMV